MHREKSKDTARDRASVVCSNAMVIFWRSFSFSILKRTVQGTYPPHVVFQTVKRQKLLSFILLLVTLSVGISSAWS